MRPCGIRDAGHTRAMADQRIEKWRRWCDGTIESNILTMYLHRDTWHEVAKIIDDHGNLPDSYWWEFLRDTYASTQAVAVRRQADTHPDAASLGKLIQEIRDDASRITREFWIGLWGDEEWKLSEAERGWQRQYAGSVGDHLDPAIPAADFDALTDAAASVKAYVDQHVAHADSSAAAAEITLTIGEVHDAIDVIGDLFKRYYNLLTASSYVLLVPAIQHDWKAVFREPWIRPNAANSRAPSR